MMPSWGLLIISSFNDQEILGDKCCMVQNSVDNRLTPLPSSLLPLDQNPGSCFLLPPFCLFLQLLFFSLWDFHCGLSGSHLESKWHPVDSSFWWFHSLEGPICWMIFVGICPPFLSILGTKHNCWLKKTTHIRLNFEGHFLCFYIIQVSMGSAHLSMGLKKFS